MSQPSATGGSTVVVVLQDAGGPGDASALCDRIAEVAHERQASVVECDVAAFTRGDLGAVDLLCRLRLVLVREGRDMRLVNVSPRLAELLELCGVA